MDTTLSSTTRGWRIELDRDWDVLGPFPVHAREQHFLSPAYPLDLSSPIEATIDLTKYPTSLTHTAYASWSRTTADPHGTILVSHPSVPWDQIRATEGWAGLQHMNVLRGWLSVYPPSASHRSPGDEPFLRTDLLQGAFFTILPPPDSPERKTHVPEWHSGNIYTLERPPAQLVKLPVSPTRNVNVTKYEVIICGAYEIRLFGDPRAYSSPYPILTLNFSISLQFPRVPVSSLHHTERAPIQHLPAHSITPHIVDGTPFGRAIGVGVQCLDFGHQPNQQEDQGYWSVVSARIVRDSTPLPASLSLELLDGVPIRVAPTQTRVVPLLLNVSATERILEDAKELDFELVCVPSSYISSFEPSTEGFADRQSFVLRVSLPLTHVSMWTEDECVPIQATHFYGKSMPTIFMVKPPKEAFADDVLSQDNSTNKCRGNEPILALHGAGVDIISQSFWSDALPRQKYAWIVMPQGRTAWGLDWHGPSASDAFAAVSALSDTLSTAGSGRWVKWGFDPETRVVLMGHSNGGQGAWYMASRNPDRVCAVVPAAGYIKSQAYVSWSMSRFAHFVDPVLRAVLDSSLTPDDDDLFLGNLVGKPVLALHGGDDDNVPPWHTREQVGIMKTWDLNADVTYHEDPGQPHWYPNVLSNSHVQAFLDRVYFSSNCEHSYQPSRFTLTVAVPAESGSMNGWRIRALITPGMLGRLQVRRSEVPSGRVEVRTTNVSVFSLDGHAWGDVCGGGRDDHGAKDATTVLTIDGEVVQIHSSTPSREVYFSKEAGASGLQRESTWKVLPPNPPVYPPYQRLQAILTTQAPLTLLVPTLKSSPELTAALRIAHTLQLFHALDAQILSIRDLSELGENDNSNSTLARTTGIDDGNLVVIGCASEPSVQGWLSRTGSAWTFVDGAWHFHGQKFDRPSSAILFLQPHPTNPHSLSLFLQSTDTTGLERAVRLFPIRTGVLAPDWIVVDGRADRIGAAGVQGAGVYGSSAQKTTSGKWVWNERISWID